MEEVIRHVGNKIYVWYDGTIVAGVKPLLLLIAPPRSSTWIAMGSEVIVPSTDGGKICGAS
jgi:hypothetical protein